MERVPGDGVKVVIVATPEVPPHFAEVHQRPPLAADVLTIRTRGQEADREELYRAWQDSGLIFGAPVARRLLADGHHGACSFGHRASAQLGDGFEYVEGSVGDGAAVNGAVQGMDGVHVSLGVEDPDHAAASPRRRARRPGLG